MRGLALQGGGAKGAYQAGAIKAFEKRKIKFDGVVGTSIGAINAAFYASGNLNSMYKLWLSTDSKELFGIENNLKKAIETKKINKEIIVQELDSIIKIIKNRGIDTSNIRKLLTKYISEAKIRSSNVDFGLVTFKVSTMQPIKISKKDIPKGKLIDYIIASAYLPCFKFEKIIDDSFYIDGGIYDNCPIDMFIKNNYDEIYIVRAWEKYKIGHGIKYPKNTNCKIIDIVPKESTGSILDFTPKKAKYKMYLGYYDTLRVLDNLDGNKYYFKRYNENYYKKLFNEKDIKNLKKKYTFFSNTKISKKFILDTIEDICVEFKIPRFNIYNMPLLIIKLKYMSIKHKNSYYFDFIDKIKVVFI